jgi:hypothetical protein
VSTVKKSTASTLAAWTRRNCLHVMADRSGAGATPARLSMAHTVLAPTLHPSRHNSPWMRRYPQVGFSLANRSTSARSSAAALERPRRWGYVQRRRTRSRCQRSSVAGCTNNRRQARRGSSRTSPATTARSAQSTRGRAPGGAAPRPRGATPAARRPWLPSFASAAQATAAPAEQQIGQSQGHVLIVVAR